MKTMVRCSQCGDAVRNLFAVGAQTQNAALVQLGTAIRSQLQIHAKQPAAKQEREENIASLEAEIEALTTAIQQLTSEIAFLQSELVRIQQETDEAIRLRKEEHDTFVKAKEDHDNVISALEKAMSALSGQYGFIQLAAHQKKQSPFAEYSSGGASGASAMEMLQDLLNRYTEARTELVQSEETAQKAHEDLLA